MGSACATCYGDAKEKSDKDEFSTSDLRVIKINIEIIITIYFIKCLTFYYRWETSQSLQIKELMIR